MGKRSEFDRIPEISTLTPPSAIKPLLYLGNADVKLFVSRVLAMDD